MKIKSPRIVTRGWLRDLGTKSKDHRRDDFATIYDRFRKCQQEKKDPPELSVPGRGSAGMLTL
ncbi:MAG TPA: hypothetical protein PK821_01680 [Victivallales bacterium]|nr:hypothetical protein [Victivallales bacterium]